VDNPLASILADKGHVVLDGALATELERRGANLDDPLWSAKLLIEAPELIQAVHRDYFRAGADVATSSSYQASFEGFRARGIDDAESERLLRLSVELARRARDEHGSGIVAASVGCYGAILHDGSEYRGDYRLTKDELVAFHRRRLEVLVSAGPDLLAFETIPVAVEAEAILALLEEDGDVPAWVSFSCRDDTALCHGESFAECVRLVSASPMVVAVGVNCTPPQFVSGLLRSARGVSDTPLLAYPNKGETWDGERHVWVKAQGATSIVAGFSVREWQELGARLIGGCCRTTPETIRAITKTLQLKTL